jgi:SulP family sulfate permease
MCGLEKLAPRLPGVLIAVVLTTLVSWLIGFEHKGTAPIGRKADPQIRALAEETRARQNWLRKLENNIAELRAELDAQDDSAAGSG